MNSLHLSGMSQHLLAIHIANSIDAINSSLEVLIYSYPLALIILNASIGEVSLHTRLSASSHQNYIGIDISDILNSSLHFEGDALLFQILAQTLGDVAIKRRETLLQELDDRNLRTKAIKHRGELHTDNSSANNSETVGECFKLQ